MVSALAEGVNGAGDGACQQQSDERGKDFDGEEQGREHTHHNENGLTQLRGVSGEHAIGRSRGRIESR